jgi:hypothetical protein
MRSSFSMVLTPNTLTVFAETTLTGEYVERMELPTEKVGCQYYVSNVSINPNEFYIYILVI